jgi:hypothetical protein
MEQLPKQLIEAAKKNRKGLNQLKRALVTLKEYELASNLREIELKSFPETAEVKVSKEIVANLKVALNMVGLQVSDDAIYTIYETINALLYL